MGKEAFEKKSISWKSRDAEGGNHRRRTGNRNNWNLICNDCLNQPEPRVRNARSPSIRDEGNSIPLPQFGENEFLFFQFIPLKIAGEWRLDPEVLEKEAGVPSVFCGDQVHFLQDMESPQADILQIPYGG